MKNKMKTVWKIIGLVILVGIVLTITGLLLGASRTLYLDRTGVHISGNKISIVEESDLEAFREINIDASFSDIEFLRSDTFGIELYGENLEWDWTLEDNILTITDTGDLRLPILHFDFFQKQHNYVKIFLPENLPPDEQPQFVSLKTGSGNIRLDDFNTTVLDISNSFGNVDIKNMNTGVIFIELGSGRFTGLNLHAFRIVYNNRFGDGFFQEVGAVGFFEADINSGNLQFTNCILTNATIVNNFGKITATDVIAFSPNIRANSGNINITGEISGEIVIHNEFGNIDLTTSKVRSDYSYDVSLKFGKLIFAGEQLKDQTSIISGTTMENHIKITSSSGNVDVSFGS